MTRDVLLQGINLTRHWGGLVAVNNVSISLNRGQVHGAVSYTHLTLPTICSV